MSAVRVRDVDIGVGIPKICVSISEKYEESILEKGRLIVDSVADIIEWRVDYYENLKSAGVTKILQDLREVIGNAPLLFTFRNIEEGGNKSLELLEYIGLIKTAIKSSCIDIIDIEPFKAGLLDTNHLSEVICLAKDHQVKIMASTHDHSGTPSKETIFSTMRAMRRLEANLIKIAVMAQSIEDVLNLLSASQEFKAWDSTIPFVAISMGELGRVSRYCCKDTGSALTFGALGEVSAPGQIQVEELKDLLIENHRTRR